MTGYDIFFALVRSGLHERPLSAEEATVMAALTEKQWKLLLHLAARQTVTGLLYTAVTQFPGEQPVPSDIVLELMGRSVGIERDTRHKTEAGTRLLERLQAEGLSPVLMKGAAVAAFYTHPLRRTAGDIDLYLPDDQIRKGLALLPACSAAPDGSRHGVFEGICIDLHARYYDLHVSPRRLPQPGTPEATLLMLSAHILKHAIGTGIGLRQLCDLAVAWRELAGCADRDRLLQAQRICRMRRWDRLAAGFLARELEMPQMQETLFPDEAPCDSTPLRTIVLSGGNFGHYAETRVQALTERERLRKRDTFRRFVRRLPFSLHYAPRETLATMAGLVRGNLSGLKKN